MVNSKAHDLSPGLLRQRRNLLVTSLILLFLHYSGAEVRSITPPGVSIELSNPEMVLKFLLLFQIYFFIRYYQYFAQEKSQSLLSAINTWFEKFTANRLHAIKMEALPNAEPGIDTYAWMNSKKIGFMEREFRCSVHDEENTLRSASYSTSLWQFIPHYLSACFLAVFNTSYLTDYVLPAIVAAYALWLYL